MAIKIKYRNPKITDFKQEDIVINLNLNGHLLEGDLIPITSGSQDLGSRDNPWRDLHILEDSIKFYKKGEGEVGKVQFEKGKGLKVRDQNNNLTITSASIFVATERFTTKGKTISNGVQSIGGLTGSIDCGLF